MYSRKDTGTLHRRTSIKPGLAHDLRGRIVRLIVVSLRSKLYTTTHSGRATIRLYNQIRIVELDSAVGLARPLV